MSAMSSKNLLTSLRSAVETLQYARTDEQRARLNTIVKDDVRSLDRLITDIADASRLDAELARARPSRSTWSWPCAPWSTSPTRPRRTVLPTSASRWCARPMASTSPSPFSAMTIGLVRWCAISSTMPLPSRRQARPSRFGLRRPARQVEFRVDDEGPGINPDQMARIFDRFYTDRPPGYFGKNSGLGLSISRQIVEAHGGKITAANRHAAATGSDPPLVLGARFTVRLPAVEGDRTTEG